uniref:Uncharacterized protein n=1 Tax=Oryza barthii TaxID=65489 RepID=A0A0D3GMC7_9ORYZ
MATRFLAGKLLAAALRRRTAVSKSAAAPSSSVKLISCLSSEATITLIVSYFAYLLTKEIAEIIRYNRFHRRCIMGSVVLGMGLAGVSCVWYTHNHRKAVREVFRELEPELKQEILRKYSSPSN